MKRRTLILSVVVVLLATWVGAAVYRTNDAQGKAYRVVMAYPPAERAKMVAPGASGPDVRVPLMQLMLNPFKSKPRAYLFSGDFVLAEVTY